MPTIAVNINLGSIGIDAGPFTISDNVSGVIVSGVPRTSLLANYVVNADDTATQITVTSTGLCTSTITIPIDFHPCEVAPPSPPPPPPPSSIYDVELRMNGLFGTHGTFTLYQSPDNSTFTQSVQLFTIDNEVSIFNFNGTPGYYYYYEVEKTFGSSCTANAYNTVLATDFSPGNIEGAYCGSNSVTFLTFQLPTPFQSRTYISFNGSLDGGCL